ncbi:cytochrome c biogenesis CcdA family protein [Desulfitobacterium sp.]|uniref:cytochrome c biogenesis CcdA family protein n=1 Tax=Desulfitobacterium sp. TaxID=49981 RepID=UPI002C782F0C|nr:cytochrome c biogenesis protein CcdA [Desulfitobacterium sp.]HVJ47678.1 cytochrome c biogenesis protein CcdA [Desulfitobacterium sp.]
MDPLVHSLHLGLQSGSWTILLSMFAAGVLLSLNPCMGAMAPLVLAGTRKTGYLRSLQFIAGFTGTLMLMGALVAGLGRMLTLPGWFWTIFLGLLYLIAGMALLQVRLPIKISGFYVSRRRLPSQYFNSSEGLSPGLLGIFFALAPSPCTTPVILVISGVAVASGKILLASLALGLFGLGHSILLALAFLPGVRQLFRVNNFTRYLRPVFGVVLLLLAGYFLVFRPELFDHASLTGHLH